MEEVAPDGCLRDIKLPEWVSQVLYCMTLPSGEHSGQRQRTRDLEP